MPGEALTERHQDVLREVANIGAGHAATALATLTRQRILISVPRVIIAPFREAATLLGTADAPAVAVSMQILGDLQGKAIFLMAERDARHLCDHVLLRPQHTTVELEEMERSSLKEVGNILAGAYLNAVAELMRMTLLPSVPTLAVEPAGVVLSHALDAAPPRGEKIGRAHV